MSWRSLKRILVPLLIIILTVILIISLNRDEDKIEEPVPISRHGVAVIMTGAAARIPQEAALLEELDRRGLLHDLVFISGVSSGALNAVVLNGILSGKLSWNEYHRILNHLKNSDIFTKEENKLPLNTSPARELFINIFENKLGYHSIGDLPYPTGISFTHLNPFDLKKTVYRMCSRKINPETDTTLSLVDIVMASSAFPVVFPPVRISNVSTIPDVEYIDGGIGEDHVPYHALLEFEKYRGVGVEKVYIISRKSDSIPEISKELSGLGIDDRGIFNKLNISLDAILSRGIMKRLEEYSANAPELVPLTYVWIPQYSADFLLFNFDDLEEQYSLTTNWARKNKPVPLRDFLSMHQHNGN